MTLWRSQNNFNRSYFILFYFLSRTVRGFNLISPSIPEPHQKKVSQCSQIFFADWSACFSHTTHPENEPSASSFDWKLELSPDAFHTSIPYTLSPLAWEPLRSFLFESGGGISPDRKRQWLWILCSHYLWVESLFI